jgi:hypothetical protein
MHRPKKQITQQEITIMDCVKPNQALLELLTKRLEECGKDGNSCNPYKIRRDHDFTSKIQIKSLPIPVYCKQSQPLCVICEKCIHIGHPRTTFAWIYAGREDQIGPERPEVCDIHVYHARCMATYLATVKEGAVPHCWGRARMISTCHIGKHSYYPVYVKGIRAYLKRNSEKFQSLPPEIEKCIFKFVAPMI